jgi:hypothetical protein
MGWLRVGPETVKIPAGSPTWMVDKALAGDLRSLCISAWLDDPAGHYFIIPSQTMLWTEGQTVAQMLESTREHHQRVYGPGGKWQHEPQIGLDEFMRTAEGMARFILSGLAWLDQKVVLSHDEIPARPQRREFHRVTKQRADAVRVISLRKVDRSGTMQLGDIPEGVTKAWTYDHRWTVDGHWRNQPCGPKHGDRKLTWINPYVKGPDDKPLKVAAKKVYKVDR